MHWSEWMARFLRCYKSTIDLLDRIEEETGYGYKDLTCVDVADFKDCPTWFDGKIEIGDNNDPEAIAHELAHGLHEKIRESGKSDSHGEEFADAVRYYVEYEMQTQSRWTKKFNKAQNRFTSKYTLPQFMCGLRNKSLFDETDWK